MSRFPSLPLAEFWNFGVQKVSTINNFAPFFGRGLKNSESFWGLTGILLQGSSFDRFSVIKNTPKFTSMGLEYLPTFTMNLRHSCR